MSKALTTDYKLDQIYIVHPDEIIVRDDLRGRSKPLPEEKIRDLAESICSAEQEPKQLQPALCRFVDGKLELCFGFTRHAAIKLALSESMPGVPEGLRVQIKEMNDQEATLANIRENKKRNDPNPIDDAANIQRLLSFGLKQSQVAKEIGITEAWVSGLKRLNALSDDEKQLVIDKRCTAALGIELAKLNKKLRTAAIKFSKDADGNIDQYKFREWERAQAEGDIDVGEIGGDGGEGDGGSEGGDEEGSSSTKPASKALKPKEIREFWSESAEALDWPLPVREFSRQVLRWMDGKITGKTLTKKMEKLIYDNLTDEAKVNLEEPDEPEDESTEESEE